MSELIRLHASTIEELIRQDLGCENCAAAGSCDPCVRGMCEKGRRDAIASLAKLRADLDSLERFRKAMMKLKRLEGD